MTQEKVDSHHCNLPLHSQQKHISLVMLWRWSCCVERPCVCVCDSGGSHPNPGLPMSSSSVDRNSGVQSCSHSCYSWERWPPKGQNAVFPQPCGPQSVNIHPSGPRTRGPGALLLMKSPRRVRAGRLSQLLSADQRYWRSRERKFPQVLRRFR